LLRGERIDGFADRPELDAASRRLIAGWARAFTPELLDAKQRRLLGAPAASPKPLAEELRRAAIDNAERDMPLAIDHGLFALLTDDQLRAMREPWTVLKATTRREYPLSVGEIAKLTDTTARQIRYWHDSQLLPAFWIDGRRYFFSAAVVHSFALARLDRNEIRGASRVLSVDAEDPVAAIVAVALARSHDTGASSGLARWLAPKAPRRNRQEVQVAAYPRFFVGAGAVRVFGASAFPYEYMLEGPRQWELPPPAVEYLAPPKDAGVDVFKVLASPPDRKAVMQLYVMAGHHVAPQGSVAQKVCGW
jgi:hypothetical protein